MDWVMDHFGWIFLIGLMVIIGGAFFATATDNAREKRFMAECQQDHKRYECEALWRQGEPRTTVVPMPVYVAH